MMVPDNTRGRQPLRGGRSSQVELFTIMVLVTLGFAILGIATAAFGTDSRPTMQDDWRRAW